MGVNYLEKLELDLDYKGLWHMKHKINAPSWKDIAKVVILKAAGKKVDLGYEEDSKNALMNGGGQAFLDLLLGGVALPGTPYYFGLGNNGGTPGVPAITTTLAGITEVSGTGYGRIAMARNQTNWPAATLATNYSITSASKVFTAGGTWTAADYLFLCEPSSGTSGVLYATVALSASRSLLNTDTLTVSMKVTLS